MLFPAVALCGENGYKPSVNTHTPSFREEFLNTIWVPYPGIRDLNLAGRVLAVEKTSLKLFIGDKAKSVKIKRVSKRMMKNWQQWERILIPGDIIGIQKNGQCIMLAPWRATDGEYTEDLNERVVRQLTRQAEWNRFIEGVNQFFTQRGFLAVTTPTLVKNPGPEPTIDVFKTMYKQGKQQTEKFLITSPELHLKKIVSQTLTPVYEIAKVYRNNEHSPRHQPEFWMIEWYRPFDDLSGIVDDVKNLILFLIKHLGIKRKKPRFEHITFAGLLRDCYAYEFKPDTSADELKQWLKKQSVYFSDVMTLDDLFTLVNLELVETKINPENIVFLNEYPPYAAALAKLDEQGWAQRFEVYWHGLELGNAFNELNDPYIQAKRLEDDNMKKKENGLEPLPIDTEFLESLKRGLPPTAGISIGLERLFMALYNETDISKLKWF